MTLVSSMNPQVETAFRPGVQAPAAAPSAPVPTLPVSPSQVPPSQTLPAPNAPVAPVGEAMTSFRLADLAQLDSGLAAGDSGPLVVTVQQHLRRLGYYPGDAHGGFDEPTSEAVRRFQAAARVVEDPPGTVGRATAVALEAGGDQPEMAVGSRGDDVHRLQHALIVALGQPLQPSGTYGTTTAAAVRDYQSSRGLPVDGAVGARTWAALQTGR
jgi:peptidoglycan hydrolase-like protein with peptidoglycan-binding domain